MFYIYIHIIFSYIFFAFFFFTHSFRGRFFFSSRCILTLICADIDAQRDFRCFNRKRFFLSGYRSLFLACVNSARWMWSFTHVSFFVSSAIKTNPRPIQWNDNLLKITFFALHSFHKHTHLAKDH